MANEVKVPNYKVPQANNPTQPVSVPYIPTAATRIVEPLIKPENVEPPKPRK